MIGYLQHDINDCGVACIATICKMIGRRMSINDIRKQTYIGKDGLSLYGMVQTFNKINIATEALAGTLGELLECFCVSKFPMIAMINKKDGSHYVVIYKIKYKKVFLWDPDVGKRTVSLDEFDVIWSGYIISVVGVEETDDMYPLYRQKMYI